MEVSFFICIFAINKILRMWINRTFRDVNSLTYFLNENDKIISNVNISVAPRQFGLIYFVAVFKVEEGKENELIETD